MTPLTAAAAAAAAALAAAIFTGRSTITPSFSLSLSLSIAVARLRLNCHCPSLLRCWHYYWWPTHSFIGRYVAAAPLPFAMPSVCRQLCAVTVLLLAADWLWPTAATTATHFSSSSSSSASTFVPATSSANGYTGPLLLLNGGLDTLNLVNSSPDPTYPIAGGQAATRSASTPQPSCRPRRRRCTRPRALLSGSTGWCTMAPLAGWLSPRSRSCPACGTRSTSTCAASRPVRPAAGCRCTLPSKARSPLREAPAACTRLSLRQPSAAGRCTASDRGRRTMCTPPSHSHHCWAQLASIASPCCHSTRAGAIRRLHGWDWATWKCSRPAVRAGAVRTAGASAPPTAAWCATTLPA